MTSPDIFDVVGTNLTDKCKKCSLAYSIEEHQLDDEFIGIVVKPCNTRTSRFVDTAKHTTDELRGFIGLMDYGDWCPIMREFWRNLVNDRFL